MSNFHFMHEIDAKVQSLRIGAGSLITKSQVRRVKPSSEQTLRLRSVQMDSRLVLRSRRLRASDAGWSTCGRIRLRVKLGISVPGRSAMTGICLVLVMISRHRQRKVNRDHLQEQKVRHLNMSSRHFYEAIFEIIESMFLRGAHLEQTYRC